MIKECKVIKNNGVVAIALFNNVSVQIPSEFVNNNVAYIKFENNRHCVVTKAEYNRANTKPIKKQTNHLKGKNIEDKIVIDTEE